jgi:hypothetical protein
LLRKAAESSAGQVTPAAKLFESAWTLQHLIREIPQPPSIRPVESCAMQRAVFDMELFAAWRAVEEPA